MEDEHKDRMRHLRLAQTLAGSEVEGLKAIGEIRSLAKLAHFHAGSQEPEDVDIRAVDGALSVIEQHAKVAEMRYMNLLEALNEFMLDYDVPASWDDDKLAPSTQTSAPTARRRRKGKT